MIKFTCPHCQKKLNVKDEFAGRKGKCPACQNIIVAPSLPAAPADEAAQSPPSSIPPPPLPSEPATPSSESPPSEVHKPPAEPPVEQIPAPPPLPPDVEFFAKQPTSFFGKLLYSTEAERKNMIGLIIGSAVIGAISGFLWGGLYDPWRTQGVATAILNSFLFGGWGAIEGLGVLIARNFRMVKRRERLVIGSALGGGLWVGLWTALDFATDPEQGGPKLLAAITGLIIGTLIGGGISIVSTLKLSKMMCVYGEQSAGKPAGTTPMPIRKEKKGMSTGAKVALGVGIGCLVIILIGAAVAGFFVYRVMRGLEDIEQEMSALNEQVIALNPESLQALNLDDNLIQNGSFSNLDHWIKYDGSNPEDQTSLVAGDNYVMWTRTNSRAEGGGIGVYQENLDIVLSGADSLTVDMDVWIAGHTLFNAGWSAEFGEGAAEVPAHVTITYLDQQEQQQVWDRGFLSSGASSLKNVLIVPEATWTHFSFDLMNSKDRIGPQGNVLPAPAKILKVMVYGNGWDFKGAVGNLQIQVGNTPESRGTGDQGTP